MFNPLLHRDPVVMTTLPANVRSESDDELISVCVCIWVHVCLCMCASWSLIFLLSMLRLPPQTFCSDL